MRSLFVFVGLLFSFSACTSKPGLLGQGTMEIADFDFSTNISVILPDRYKNPDSEGSYNIPSPDGTTHMMCRDGGSGLF